MANQWYYTKDDERQGPVSADELKKMVEAGELLPDDLIWKDGMDDWRPASQLKGLFPVDAANPQPPPAAVAGGARSAAWQIPQLIAATMLIVAMFLPWWGARLSGSSEDLQKAFSKQDGGNRRGNRFGRSPPDMEKFRRMMKDTGWYLRNADSASIDFRKFPFGGPDRDEVVDIRVKVWGVHMGLGLAGGFFGFALLPLAIIMMISAPARRFSWTTSFLAAYISVLLCLMTVIWYFETPGYDIKPVFSQGAHIGPYLAFAGNVLLLAFGLIDGIAGVRAWGRRKE